MRALYSLKANVLKIGWLEELEKKNLRGLKVSTFMIGSKFD